ncbi:hypothetical protein GH714_037467 [Hevea brasiliensis]|uniref:tRNA(Phe) (4-demethylwyosine(37)-C(7)) aminocarboxypropyltransferase n=1 Tax=Hevea brasiliensis TaxID=3981 RepID=A0A6A6LWY4_HEVBR|nr:hypothetical protein GH714_037467 [Hevea brasiliensis]
MFFLRALTANGFVGSAVSENVVHTFNDIHDGAADSDNLESANEDTHIGNLIDYAVSTSMTGGVSDCGLSIVKIVIVGEPLEKLFLWGHSACTLDHKNSKGILVFGGFGGMGRHARRNDTLLLDPLNGTLKAIDAVGAPSPRLSHTASLVGDFLFVIGGRSDPLNILDDVWILNTASNEWRLSECTGMLQQLLAQTYVFGGLNNDTIFSSMHVLNTGNLQWEEVLVGGEQPCARHSHSMVAYGSTLFMFGGYNGEKALGDLYSFDVQTHIWKKEKTSGGSPHPRFSHSLFAYNNFLGVIGGCPIRQHSKELALLDLRIHKWKHVSLDYIGKELLVRSTTNIVGNDLVVIGGGAACYAFGTKFSEPLKISLLPLVSFEDKFVSLEIGEKHVSELCDGLRGEKNINQGSQVGNAENSTYSCRFDFEAKQCPSVASCWVLKLEKKCAKLGKDMLKKFGWLDLTRKVRSEKDELAICFPITEKFYAVFSKIQHQYGDVVEGQNNITEEGFLLNEVSCSTAMFLLKECGATVLADEVAEVRRTVKSPLQIMKEAVASLIKCKGISSELLEQLPTRWEQVGDIFVLPITSFKDPSWDLIGEELWPTIARSLNCQRLARKGRVAPTGTRDSTLEILVGDNGWVDHKENGILYSFDATKCMFSWGNLSEKLRMAHLDCQDEAIVDLFAGIGYFVLPFLVRAGAKLVYACEWNPHAVEALKRNLEANSVSDRSVVLEGDNRMIAPRGVANRVCLGLLPSSEGSWVTAVRALRIEGGMLHVHGNVKDSEESSWTEHVLRSMDEIARSEEVDEHSPCPVGGLHSKAVALANVGGPYPMNSSWPQRRNSMGDRTRHGRVWIRLKLV